MTEPPAGAPAVVVLRATRAEAPGAALRVGGLPVVERALRQLGRLPGVRVVVVTDGAVALPAPLPANVEVRAAGAGAAAGSVDVAAALAAVEAELGHPPVVAADVVNTRPLAAGGAAIRVVDEATRRAAEDAVFADLLRGDLGLVARHINKKVSFRITRHLLCRLPITPNQVTLGAGVVGLVGCLLIAGGARLGIVAGFLLMQLQSILDGCDGELARVRFQQTASGEWLDTVVDDALNLALAAAVGVGLARHADGAHPYLPWLALPTCLGLLTCNVIAYRELVRQGEGGELLKVRWWFARGQSFKAHTGSSGPLFSALNVIGKRDFFVLAWTLLAIADLLPVVLVYAFVMAMAYAVAAVGQLVVPRPPPPPA